MSLNLTISLKPILINLIENLRSGDSLKRKGGTLIAPPEVFVKGREGPLKEGELEKVKKYAKDMVNKCRERI